MFASRADIGKQLALSAHEAKSDTLHSLWLDPFENFNQSKVAEAAVAASHVVVALENNFFRRFF